jgi:tetratricopeptide (TPR) repeat protein
MGVSRAYFLEIALMMAVWANWLPVEVCNSNQTPVQAASRFAAIGLQAFPELPSLSFDTFGPGIREQVQKAYDEARRHPQDAIANGRLGMLLQAYQQYEFAATCYERALYLSPDAFEWKYYLGTVKAALGKHAEAAAIFQEALRLKPDYLPAQIKLAESLLSSGDLHRSQEVYAAILKKYPHSALAQYGMGRVKAAQGELALAVEHYRRACELFKDFGAAHYALALAYRDLGQIAKASEHLSLYQKNKLQRPTLEDPLLDQVAELNTGPAEYISRGIKLEAAGRIDEAIQEHLRALMINPRLAQAHINLIILYGKLGRLEKAEQHYRASIQINPNLADSHYNFGVILSRQGRYKEAAEAFRRAFEINPFHAEAHHNYAAMIELEGRLDEAAQHYRKAIENRPNYRQAHFHLGRILVEQGKLTEAIDHFLQTLTPEDENTPTFMYALAAAYARSGNRPSAIHYAREARSRAAALGQKELLALIERDLRILEQTGIKR